jgi:hypothetical protein
VRDVKSSEAEADDEFPKFCHKAVSQDSIKRAHGFVKKKHPWRWRKRSSERNALSLSPGQRGHIARTEISETDKFKDFGHSNRTFSLGDFRHPQPEGHIVRDAEMRKQCMLLEHQADPSQVRRGRCDVDAVENDRHSKARGQGQEAADAPPLIEDLASTWWAGLTGGSRTRAAMDARKAGVKLEGTDMEHPGPAAVLWAYENTRKPKEIS